ncbi:class I adenylate-forming enzyme family protein [Vibrio aestuarianus]|uniref:Class I adenylate-forming enzyme family protein n=1 Tax=Vibrio aestuarianus TaxID=28171 RepID=A0ABD7YLV8_9VIBR|nr:class I adenylate-forming enzyme family protein [Vibrio aestuarianus]MDE1231967.1 acyl--CoA ligase [Vibrio aestuarianus]MDE1328748.1 acyl--CoA ligase [Vibrio aestuarianus]WGK85794.1 class I adenylate-forming enzyme family protein [Vibrio aestuarianus]CAH8204903.1 O-succinylbenzoate--CoA ligase [Vibrio aestuarianus]
MVKVKTTISEMEMTNMFDKDASSLAHLCDKGLSLYPDRIALIQDEQSITYGELEERINRVANGLISLGVKPFERVLVIFENDIRFPEVMLGIIRAGAIATPLNFKLKPQQHTDLAQDCESRIVLGSAGKTESVLACLSDGGAEVGIVVDAEHGPLRSYEAWLASSSPERCDHSSAGNDLCIQAYTSGSTGRPKGVLLGHHGLLRTAQLLVESNRINQDSRVLLSTPLFHMNATAAGILPCLSQGGSVVILKQFDADRVIDEIDIHRCTYTTGVPASYELILAAARQKPHADVSSLEFINVGSAPMTRTLLDELVHTLPNVDVIEGYGLTECPIITLNPRGQNKLGTIGRALPGFECKVIDSDGNTVPQGEEGELIVRSECNALGYHNRPDAQAERFRDGWVYTGDIVSCAPDGWFTFKGRIDDQMNVGGENVFPAEVENILATHPEVRDVSVVPVPHEVKGQVPVAFVVRNVGANLSEKELINYYIAHGAAYSHPRRIFFIDEMPLLATGKADLQALTKQAREAA